MVDIRNIEEVVLPSYTYQVKNGRIHGYIDGLEAMRQAVEKILLTERFEWVIYSSNYGVELERLIGKPYDFVKADLERTISSSSKPKTACFVSLKSIPYLVYLKLKRR